jgi:hypothetical protein
VPIPGFYAAASVSRSPQHYATVSRPGATLSPALIAALPIGNGGGPSCPTFTPCDSNCMRTVHPCQGGSFSESCCGQGFRCESGTCVCPPPNTNCGTSCSNTQTDAGNCGSCGNNCNGGTCVAGKCDCSSVAGLSPCGTTCANFKTDSNNCGRCGNACSGLSTCHNGSCNCSGPQTWGSLSNNGCAGCSQPGVAVFSATLNNVPSGQDPLSTCQCTPGPSGAPINGRLPDRCANQTILGFIGLSTTGYWNVFEGQCSAQAQGCGSGGNSSCPNANPGCMLIGTSCYGALQFCNYCCPDRSYIQQGGWCIGYYQAPPCFTPPPDD